MARVRPTERGFTLIEVMIVVVLIGIVAALVVPGWFKTSRQAKAETEVSAMFAELAIREAQYKGDVGNGRFLAAVACPTAVPGAEGVDASACIGSGQPWATLRVNLPSTILRCNYRIATDQTGAATPTGFTFTASVGSWYWILAECNTDDVAGTNSQYFTSSVDTTIQRLNRGM